jgi:hypothetical protein
MQERIQTRSTAKTAIYAVGSSLVVVFALAGLQRLTRDESPLAPNQLRNAESVAVPGEIHVPGTANNLLVPVIELTVADASMESNWSAALATTLHGRTEASVESGRVDVLTSSYAIEVDRLDKWHEGIGQAAHYALLTKAMPVVALIVPSDNWPLSESTRAKLLLIDETCTSQNVKLILLRRVNK